jgi:MFS superfamily sulfate permease-like transporter
VITSLVALSYQAAHPRVYLLGRKPGTDVFRPLSSEHPEDETFEGLMMVRTEGRLFFANAQHVGDQVMALIEREQPQVVALDCSAIPDIEYSALKLLIEAEERLRGRGVLLWVVRLNPEARQMVERSPLWATLGPGRLFLNMEAAVEAYRRGLPRSSAGR